MGISRHSFDRHNPTQPIRGQGVWLPVSWRTVWWIMFGVIAFAFLWKLHYIILSHVCIIRFMYGMRGILETRSCNSHYKGRTLKRNKYMRGKYPSTTQQNKYISGITRFFKLKDLWTLSGNYLNGHGNLRSALSPENLNDSFALEYHATKVVWMSNFCYLWQEIIRWIQIPISFRLSDIFLMITVYSIGMRYMFWNLSLVI